KLFLIHHHPLLVSPVVLVGIGSVKAATAFASDIGLMSDPTLKDRIILVTDETGSVTEALDCYRGWLTVDKKHKERYPFTDIHPAIKLLGMIFGCGSPGTFGKVIEGYTGDITKNYGFFGRQWVIQALSQGGEKGRFPQVDVSLDTASNLQPFELATLRLQTGLHIASKWGKLGPKDGDLFTRMGGTFVFSNKECIFEHFDLGILNFANMDDVCLVAEAAGKGQRYVVPTSKSQAKKNRAKFWERKDDEAKRQIQENIRRAEEARREEELRAKEAKLAEEARLEELDRIEAARIAEVVRQAEEAKKAQLAAIEAEKEEAARVAEIARKEEEAKKAQIAAMEAQKEAERLEAKRVAEKARKEEATKKAELEARETVERLEAERKELEARYAEESNPPQEPHVSDATTVEASIDEILLRAEEQEQKIRASLEAIQSEPDVILLRAEEQDKKIRKSLEAIQNLQKASTDEPEHNGRKAIDVISTPSMADEIVAPAGSSNPNTNFQSELLAARIKFDKPSLSRKGQAEVTLSVTNSVPASAEKNGAKNGSKNGSENGSKDSREVFQRNLLASRLKYEGSH
ncbi:MAG: hypothetical protein SGILL_005634, partial [Bacillariaceae sp.]